MPEPDIVSAPAARATAGARRLPGASPARGDDSADMVDRAPIGVYQSTPDGRILTANRALARVLGYETVPELLAVSLADIYVDRRERELLVAAFEKVGTSAEVELQWKRRDGKPLWVQVNAHTILDPDGSRRFEGFVRDITHRRAVEQELRDSEERLRLVARATNDAVWDWNVVTNEVWLGEGFHSLFGLRADEPLRPFESWAERVHPDDRERVIAGRKNVIVSGAQFWSDEYRFRRSDGAWADVYDRGYVLHDAQRAVRMVGSLMDITGRKRAEQELLAQREKLGALSQRMLELQETERRFVARELHDELGQLLTATKLTFQAVQRTRSADTTRRKLREGLKLLDQCLQQVRWLSLRLRPSMLDDLGLGPALRWYVDRQAERVGYELRLDDRLGDQRLPTDIETICFRVAQEALTNVARHAGARHVQVTVSRAAERVEMVIADDGVGFDVAQARARAVAGESLGLLGMEERASLAGGQLRVHSRPGGGTDVHLTVPVPA